MQKTILKFSLFLLTLVAAFFSWHAVDAAINVPEASTWGAPIVWFSAFFILLSLSSILIKEFYLILLEAFFAAFLSMIFVVSVGHFLLTIIALLFLLFAISKIRNDLQLNIRVSVWKTIRTGSTIIIFAFGLMIASQYYYTVKDLGVSRIIPKFKMQGLSSALTSKILSAMNPDFKNLNDDGLTVDQLILQTQKNQLEQEGGSAMIPDSQIEALIAKQYGKNLSASQKAEIKKQYLQKISEGQKQLIGGSQDMVLEEGRKQLAQIIGTEITGQEKVADLFAEVINNKINNYVIPKLTGDGNFPILPFVMTSILFLTVVPLGSFLSPLWILLINLIFRILIGTGVVSIKKVMREVEVLE